MAAKTPQERLDEAEEIYHEWSTGQTVRAFTDQNGERVEYSQAGMRNLTSYIAGLRAEIAGGGKRPVNRPLRFTFG